MSSSDHRSDNKSPIVERPPGGEHDGGTTAHVLEMRLRQQELLAKLGVLALQGSTLNELLDRTARLTAEGMEADFCKVMEYLPAENRLLVRAGVGWDRDVIGKATIGADLESPGGYALHTGKPVISNHLNNEERFRTPELLLKYGIRRAINVILQGGKEPFGVLEVDSRAAGEFTENDLAFLQGAANILGMAIERQRIERDLMDAVESQKLLFEELNHRVKNSLQLAATTLELQAGLADDDRLRQELREASARISTIGRAHDGLYQGGKVLTIDLGAYLTDICRSFAESMAACDVTVAAPVGIEIATNQAIPIALVVNELVTNAVKYAYPEGAGCRVWIKLEAGTGALTLSVRDEGIGLPTGFDIAKSTGLGMRIVRALTQQLRGSLDILSLKPGTEFRLRLPLTS
jgi:two-component sensor histidine kinase